MCNNFKIENFQDEPRRWKYYKKEYFKDSEIIVRAPGGFFFWGEHAVMYGQPAVYMAIPLYFYVGLRKSATESVHLKDYWECDFGFTQEDPLKREIKLSPHNDDEKREAFSRVIDFLKEKGFKGFDVTIVSEIPNRCGLDCAGAMAATVSVAVHLFNLELTADKINSWRSLNTLEMTDWIGFDKVFRLAWMIESLWHTHGSSGAGVMNALLGAPKGLPIFFCGEYRGGDPNTCKKEFGPTTKPSRALPNGINGKIDYKQAVKAYQNLYGHDLLI
jgi:hypothetical protein